MALMAAVLTLAKVNYLELKGHRNRAGMLCNRQ